MLIKEQIKIARMIASGTPREVAIQEQFRGKMSATADRSGAVEAEVVKDKQNKLPQGKKDGKEKKLSPSETSKAKLDAKRKKIALDRKVEMLRRSKNTVKNAAADAIKGTSYSKASTQQVSKDEGGATATQKVAGNVAKTGVAATKNVAKGLAKAVVGIRGLKRGLSDRKYKGDLYKVAKKEKDMKNEEFIQEVEDKKDSKAKKVIDIMKGKNPIKINPDVKEDTVVVQDASGKDFVEIVDIITPEKIRSDWRKEINVTEAAAWTRKAGKSKSGGLNEKGRKSYERQNPGSDLKAPSKKVGNPRRKSFCARMKGMKKKLTSAKTARDPDSRINKSLRAWNC